MELRTAIDETPSHNLLAILGDMNAKLSSAHVGYTFDKRTNENGFHLLELACEKSLMITNNHFQKKAGKRWTFEDPKQNRYQLDYILVNNKWKNSVMNVEPYSSFSSIGSDHRIVTAQIRLSLRAPKPAPHKKRFDWKVLKYDKQLCKDFEIELKNRFSELYVEGSATKQFGALIQAKDETAEMKKCFPLPQRVIVLGILTQQL